MEKNEVVQKIRFRTFLFLFILLFFLLAIVVFFSSYLFQMQRFERLRKISNFQDFTISVKDSSVCETSFRFVVHDVSYYYDCIDTIYLAYGSTKTTLNELLSLGYFELKDILRFLKKQSTEKENVTNYILSSFSSSLIFEVETNEDEIEKVTIHKYREGSDSDVY